MANIFLAVKQDTDLDDFKYQLIHKKLTSSIVVLPVSLFEELIQDKKINMSVLLDYEASLKQIEKELKDK